MFAALTFSPGQALMIAVVILALLVVTVWGIVAGERDRVRRARDRAYLHEVRHLSDDRGTDE